MSARSVLRRLERSCRSQNKQEVATGDPPAEDQQAMATKTKANDNLLLTGALCFVAGGALVYQFLARRKNTKRDDPSEAVEQAIRNRRSVQAFDCNAGRTVLKEHIDRLLEVANWAPTHGKTEPWRFVVFESDAARLALGEKDAAIYKAISPPESFAEKKYHKKINTKVTASYVIAICMKRQESKKIPLEEEQMAVACAVQNMHLLGSAMGLGCCWLSGPTVRTADMKDYLQLQGPDDECLGFFCVGRPDTSKTVSPSQRRPIQEKVRWV